MAAKNCAVELMIGKAVELNGFVNWSLMVVDFSICQRAIVLEVLSAKCKF